MTRLVGEHQTMIVASRQDLLEVAVRMFSRRRHENYFKYARTHFGLDAMDSYGVVDDDLERRVPNPARKRLKQELTRIEDALVKLQAENAELGAAPGEAHLQVRITCSSSRLLGLGMSSSRPG